MAMRRLRITAALADGIRREVARWAESGCEATMQLIARRVRECRVYSELIPYDTPVAEIASAKPAGIILSGGPRSVNHRESPTIDPALFELGVPVLGICYGLQLMAKVLGGVVERTDVAEYGGRPLKLSGEGVLLGGLPSEMTCWMRDLACSS